MNSFTKISLVSTLALSAPLIAAAQDMTSEFSVDFQVGSSAIEPFVGSNARSIARLTDLLNAVKDDPLAPHQGHIGLRYRVARG